MSVLSWSILCFILPSLITLFSVNHLLARLKNIYKHIKPSNSAVRWKNWGRKKQRAKQTVVHFANFCWFYINTRTQCHELSQGFTRSPWRRQALFHEHVPLLTSCHRHPEHIREGLNWRSGRDGTSTRNMKEAEPVNSCLTEVFPAPHSVMSVLFSYYQFIQLQVCASCNRHWFWTWRILERRSYNLSKFCSQEIKKKTGWKQSLGRQTTGSPSEGNMTLSNMQVQTKW